MMHILMIKAFGKWAKKQRVSNELLSQAIQDLNAGHFDANLGGGVYKKRLALEGRGKRGGARTLIAFKMKKMSVFMYAFAKNERDNITDKELRALKLLAKTLFQYSAKELDEAVKLGELVEINDEEIDT